MNENEIPLMIDEHIIFSGFYVVRDAFADNASYAGYLDYKPIQYYISITRYVVSLSSIFDLRPAGHSYFVRYK
jgi:hypothetical protein